MSLAGVKKKCKKCYQIWFWRLLAFVIFLAINSMCSDCQFVFKTTL
jgi:ribosomal protein L36